MAAACRGGAQLARGLGLTPAAWVLAARQRPTSAGGRAGGSSGLAGCAQHASHVSASRARCAAAQLLRPSALTAGPAAAALASQRTLALGGGAAIGAGGSRAGAVAAAAAAAAGLRSVGTVHRGKIIGNVMEAWERRTVDGIVEKRDPAHFDDFRVGDSVAVRFVNVWNPQKLATFSGICIARRGGILRASFTLRNHIDGYAMEQQFPLNSPLLRGIRVIKEPLKRKKRAKLYYLRDRAPKESTVVVNEKDLDLPTAP